MMRILLKKKVCLLALLLLPLFVHAQEQEQEPEQSQIQNPRQNQNQNQNQNREFNFGSFHFALTPRILEDGSITDFSIGMMYWGAMGAEIQFRSTQTATNEEISGVDDSLNAVKGTTFEVFVLPVHYRFVQKDKLRASIGAGVYYEYDKLDEKGFYTWNELEEMFIEHVDPQDQQKMILVPMERVNSYKNDFTMHLVGPLLDGKFSYYTEWFGFGLTVGVVPIFNTSFAQTVRMEPMFYPKPGTADISESSWGSPYFYFTFDTIIAKYLNATFSYNYAKLKKKEISPGFDGYIDDEREDKLVITDRYWSYIDQSVVNQSIMIEISALLPVGGGMSFQAGWGYQHSFISYDSRSVIDEGKHYLILSTKKTTY